MVEGEKIGRTLGFPTLNLEIPGLQLDFGVYACRVDTPDGRFKGAMHFGPRKILNIEQPLVEVHLLDFSGDLYGEKVDVHVLKKIRGTVDFVSMEKLKQQIADDVEQVRNYHIPF